VSAIFLANMAEATFAKRVDPLGKISRKAENISNRAEVKIKIAQPANDERNRITGGGGLGQHGLC
jgi:hypothetical protein